MHRKILIPLDGSKTAEKVLPYARLMANKLEIPVELLAVINLPEIVGQVAAENTLYLDRLIEEAVKNSRDYLNAVAKTLGAVEAKCVVEKGRPEEVILERSMIDKGTLIAMATHGRSGLQRWLLGSVAEKVLRGGSTPLLLIRASEENQTAGQASIQSAIVPLDGSALAETVLPVAIALAKSLKLEVILASAYRLPATAYYRAEDYPESKAYLPSYKELTAEMSRETRSYLEGKVEAVRSQGVERVKAEIMEGPAPDEIIRLARNTRDTLIVMCTHGRSGVKRWVLGSVTEKVARHSVDPVLVIRAD
jgi:nucleotide-binding universal stress UspA family protein